MASAGWPADRGDTMPFLDALFGAKPEAAYVVLWELAGRRSSSFQDLAEASSWADGRTNLYVHAGLTLRAFSGSDRPSADQIDGLPGLWADIDIASPVHKKAGLPPDELTARRVAASPGLAPSCVVHSGHGLQCWWLLGEPWLLESPAERRSAATLVRAWDLSLRQRAARLGATLDAVGDLPRLMRLPGTVNHKPGAEPVPVRLLELSPTIRYGVEDFEAHLLDGCYGEAERELVGRSRPSTNGEGDLVLHPGAEPPFEKLVALAENEPRAWQTWQRTRRDAKTWSASEYDLALARYAAMANWTRQEIANLLVAARRKHGDDLKLRQDYYSLTIDKALSDESERELVEQALTTAHEVSARPAGEAVDRAGLLEKISAAIGVPIERVTRSKSEPPVFGIVSPHGAGMLGPIAVIGSNSRFRDKVAELTNRFPRRMKAETWDPLAQLLLECAEPDDLGIEATLAGHAETVLSLYLDRHKPTELKRMDAGALRELPTAMPPFVDGGITYVFGSKLRNWLAEIQHEALSNQEFGVLLRAYGAVAQTRAFVVGKKRTTRSVWALPDRTASDRETNETDSS